MTTKLHTTTPADKPRACFYAGRNRAAATLPLIEPRPTAPLTRYTEQQLNETLLALEVDGDGALADVLRALVGEVRRLGAENRALAAEVAQVRETSAHAEMAWALRERLDTLDAALAAAVAS